jgi:HK97 family phage major capsid protein
MKRAQGSELAELKTKTDDLQVQADAIERKIAERHVWGGGDDGPTIKTIMEENDGIERLLRDKKGSVVLQLPHADLLERKTAIDSAAVGASTSGVLQIERVPGIVVEARQALTVRSVLASRPTTMQLIDFVKVNSPLVIASPQIETHTKRENAVSFTTASERVRTLATWIPASRQVLDDFSELESFLRTGLSYYVDLAEELQLLTGSGAGEDLNGLITQSTSFDTALLPLSGWTKYDVIGRAIQQVTIAKEVAPSFVVLHPNDYYDILMTKNSQGNYLLPPGTTNFWGLTPVVTTSISAGQFLVGAGSSVASEIRDKMGMTVEISTSHEDYFARNMVAIRAEKRLALVVYRGASYISGSFNTSP